jgi:tetratricopeptide (TPR) repeat protein
VVEEVVGLCGCLPLAIGMVARQLHHHPAWSLAGRAAELASARDRLELMVTENLSVAAAFNLSYEDLTGDRQRLFRRLGLHPGADIDAYAAAALDGTDLAAARRGLEGLYDQYLLTEPAQGRYRLHDLIREHARGLAVRLDPDGDRDQATARLLDYYQDTAAVAEARLARQTPVSSVPATPLAPVSSVPAIPPAVVPQLPGRAQALAWLRAERANLLACLDHATETGEHARVTLLTAAMAALLRHDGPWTEAITRHAAAVAAARQLGDRLGQARALNYLADVWRISGDYPGATRAIEEALAISRDLSDRLGQVIALNEMGRARRMAGDYPEAAQDLEEALGLARTFGYRLSEAFALSSLGFVRRMTGDYPGAAGALEAALDIYRDVGDQGGEAEVLNEIGTLQRVRGDLGQAGACHQQALDLAREIGSAWDEANALAGLGRCALAAGRTAEAEDQLAQALEIFQRIGTPEVAGLTAELDALTKA